MFLDVQPERDEFSFNHDDYKEPLRLNISKQSSVDRTLTVIDQHGVVNSSTLPNYHVHVFYYPWYGNPVIDGQYLHWNHRYLPDWHKSARVWPTGRHKPPEDIGSSFYPRLGPYSSRDPVVVNDHMRQIRDSGAGVVVVSWYPPGFADDEGYNVDTVMPLILDNAHKYSLKVCVHIEPYKNRSTMTLFRDITYINNTYSSHPAFYRYTPLANDHRSSNSLPLYYIYDSYLIDKLEWKRLLEPGGSETIRGTSQDALFIGLLVDSSHLSDLTSAGFNGFYTYFATDGFSYGSSWRNWVRLSSLARDRSLIFIPCVGPGYDDTRIRPWNGANTRDRQHGRYYMNSFAAAIKSHPAVIAVTSFNEWGEGTQIEEAVPYTHKVNTDESTLLVNKEESALFSYSDYEPEGYDHYIKLTNQGCQRFQQINFKR